MNGEQGLAVVSNPHSISVCLHLLQPFQQHVLRSLAAPQPHCLAVLLQFCNQLISLADHVLVLLVLVVGSIGFNDALARNSIDCAGNAPGGNEAGEVTIMAH